MKRAITLPCFQIAGKTFVSRDRLNSLIRTGATVVRGWGGGGGCDIVSNQSDWLIPEILQSDSLGTISPPPPPPPPYYLYTLSLQTCLKFRECLIQRNSPATTNGLFEVQTAPEMKVYCMSFQNDESQTPLMSVGNEPIQTRSKGKCGKARKNLKA